MLRYPQSIITALFALGLMLAPPSAKAIELSRPDGEANLSSAVFKDPRTYQAFKRAADKLMAIRSKRPFRLVQMNQSLEKSAAGAEKILANDFSDATLQDIKDAIRLYDANSFAVLMQAAVTDLQDTPKANQLFQRYLDVSHHPTGFEAEFLTPVDYHELRRGVFNLLKSRGIEPSLRGQFLKKHPMPQWMADIWLQIEQQATFNMVAIIVLIGIGMFLLLNQMLGADLQTTAWRLFIHFYQLLWLSFFIYLALVFLKKESPHALLQILYLTVPAWIGWEVLCGVWGRFRPLGRGLQRCSNCGNIFSKLLFECPLCKKKLSR